MQARESPATPRRGGWHALPRNVWAVTATSFLTDVSSEMVVHLVPLFLANVLGAGTGLIGLVEGCAQTTAAGLKLVSGWLSDRLGRRKGLSVAGYTVSTLAKPFLYFAATWSAVLWVRVADRIGKGVRTAPRDALLADSVRQDERGLAFGLHRAGDTAGAVLGIAVALAVVSSMQGGALALGRETFRTLVLLSIVPAALAVAVLAAGAHDVPVAGRGDRPRLSWAGFDRRFRFYVLAVVLFSLGNSSDAFIVLRAQERGLDVVRVLGMLLTFNVVYTVVSGPAGALSDRIGRRPVVLGGWALYGAVYLGLAAAGTGAQVWFLAALYGVFYGLSEGTEKAFVADLVPAERRGTAYGVYHSAVALSALPASLVAGLLWQGAFGWSGLGPGATFLFGALMALAAIIVMAWRVTPSRQARPAARDG